MAALLLLSLVLLGTLSYVFGQEGQGISTNATCYSTYSWMNNGIGQSPCLVAAYLASACNNGYGSVYAIAVNGSYGRPAGTGINPCQCSAPVYNLMQACSYCQDGQPTPWAFWTSSCPASYISKSFPSPIPGGTEIPPWALLDPTLTGSWSYSDALAYARSPSASITPYAMTSSSTSPTSVVSVSTTPSITSTPAPAKQSSDIGAIAGAVVGGIAVLVFLILGLYYIRSRSAIHRHRPGMGWPIDQNQPYPKEAGWVWVTPPTVSDFITPLPYNPEDPSTFPPPETASPPSSGAGLLLFSPTAGTPHMAESPLTQHRFSSVEMLVGPAPSPAQMISSPRSPVYLSRSNTIDYGTLAGP